ncbi:putative kinase-like protein TMKL1 [Cynara cardunculus var. scolymus]|uniref:Protein kinase, catalytic domain-containing protein n=1 Tax=Cynara cardunculus var. scolymus TaxID=59895 RepID=A0A103YJ98_CYNCS|nr:putative kinase-like protein TMKL1 [Cynara cardunculus var. scolymus]KVI10075.1 Protein kinase, catalytic domain-containing protein [Cynara cardunculus var. scolymus]
MEKKHMLILIVTISSFLVIFVLLLFLICVCRRKGSERDEEEEKGECKEGGVEEIEMKGDLIRFEGGEDLTCFDILDAPGEVIGKSSYGTLYRANLLSDSVVLLRFLRPAACTGKVQDVMLAVQLLGSVRHPNLVPLCGFYSGPRGEKLLVHPFYRRGSLAQFIRDENGESHKWEVIFRISMGIARGLDYLHTGLQKPIIHGNLKSKNVLLGRKQHSVISDFGLHLLLNPAAAQEMLEDAAAEGYTTPELSKMKDVSRESDIYNLGVILLELVTGKEPINGKANPDQDFHLPMSMRNAILDHRMSDLYHHDVLTSEDDNARLSPVNEGVILEFVQLALACCSPSRNERPNIKQICKKLEEIGSKS